MYDFALDVLLTGVAVIVPLVVTLYVLRIAFDFVYGALEPLVKLLQWAGLIQWVRRLDVVQFLLRAELIASHVQFVTELITVVILATVVVIVGLTARVSYGETVIDYVDRFIAAIPGVGAVYNSFRRMGDVMLASEAENFQEVKLVEFPREGTYTIGFKTADSPRSVAESAGRDGMVTLFLPLAPNPVMGGFLSHVPQERVLDVDMTVEEGIRSIITSGIATDASATDDAVADMSVAEVAGVDPSTRPTDGEAGDGDRGAQNGDDTADTPAAGTSDDAADGNAERDA
jgi:uncharacterized membrane protein